MLATLQTTWKRAVAVLSRVSFLAPLLTRLTLGYAFFLTGRGKLAHFENTVAFFADQGIPFPALNAAVVARLEYYGGVLLVIGLLTRLTSLALASTMVVALTKESGFATSWLPHTEQSPLDFDPYVFLLLLLWLLFFGAGAFSLDTLIARLRPQSRSPSTNP